MSKQEITNFLMKVARRIRAEITRAKLDIITCLIYNRRGSNGKLLPPPNHHDFCDLIVITFNNAKVVDYQIRSLNKFFKYPFRYTVFDNSTNKDVAQEISAECHKFGVGYIRLPRQEFLPKGYGSYSHGIAINYAFNHYIRNGGAKYFGLLDHDMFLIGDFDVSHHLDAHQFFYGSRHYGFYIWPGLWFMTMDRLVKRGVDFRPSLHRHGDTGACNYSRHFRGINWDDYKLVDDVHHLLDNSDDDIFKNGYSILDGCWLHCWNASDYMHKGVGNKMRRIYAILEEKLK